MTTVSDNEIGDLIKKEDKASYNIEITPLDDTLIQTNKHSVAFNNQKSKNGGTSTRITNASNLISEKMTPKETIVTHDNENFR